MGMLPKGIFSAHMWDRALHTCLPEKDEQKRDFKVVITCIDTAQNTKSQELRSSWKTKMTTLEQPTL